MLSVSFPVPLSSMVPTGRVNGYHFSNSINLLNNSTTSAPSILITFSTQTTLNESKRSDKSHHPIGNQNSKRMPRLPNTTTNRIRHVNNFHDHVRFTLSAVGRWSLTAKWTIQKNVTKYKNELILFLILNVPAHIKTVNVTLKKV